MDLLYNHFTTILLHYFIKMEFPAEQNFEPDDFIDFENDVTAQNDHEDVKFQMIANCLYIAY